MNNLVILIGGIAAAAIVWKGFSSLHRGKRSDADNNWANEAYVARQDAGSWAESELAPGAEAHRAPPMIGGLGL